MIGLLLVTLLSTTDPVLTGAQQMGPKIQTYGAAVVALVVTAALVFVGVKFLKRALMAADPVERGGDAVNPYADENEYDDWGQF